MKPVSNELPEFENPPVSEVALSVQFLPLENWKSPYAGRYWNKIVDEYPQVDVKGPLLPQVEKFGPEFWQSSPRLDSLNLEAFYDLNRIWFIGRNPTDLVQLQRDRFIVNWRKVTGDEVYPRYEAEIRPRFSREWERFMQFVADTNLGDMDVQQCEVTYVNDMLRGTDWDTVADASRIISQWSGCQSCKFLPDIETFGLSGSFAMPEQQGRLRFSVQHLRRENDQKEVIQLQLTARGRPASSASRDLVAWMDMGREWIVRGFTDLTTGEAHVRWKRKA